MKILPLRLIHLIAAAAVLTNCGGTVSIASLPRAPQVWFDQPLSDSQYPLGETISVQAHARGATGPGITEMQFFANGEKIGSAPTDPSSPLVDAVQTWKPAAAGEYLLEARSVSSSGESSNPAYARVTIGERDITITPTPTRTVTPTRTGTDIPPRIVTTTVPPPRPIPVTTTVAPPQPRPVTTTAPPRIIPTTLTPTPTTPVPSQARRVNGSFSASTMFLSTPGSSVTFNWSTQASSSFTYSLVLEMRTQSGGFLQTNMATNVTQHTSSTIALPAVTTTYTLRAYYNTASEQATSQEIGSVTVQVQSSSSSFSSFSSSSSSSSTAASTVNGPFANPTTINQGQCSTLSWDAQNVRDVFLFGGELGGEPGIGVAGQGSRQVCPSSTTTYTLRVNTQSSGYVYRQVTVTVNPTSYVSPPSSGGTTSGGSTISFPPSNIHWEGTTLVWNIVSGATYYEIYASQCNGEIWLSLAYITSFGGTSYGPIAVGDSTCLGTRPAAVRACDAARCIKGCITGRESYCSQIP